jgi:hypothetical protein
MSVFLAILAGAAFVGVLYLASRDNDVGSLKRKRDNTADGGGSFFDGGAGDCGADGGCD